MAFTVDTGARGGTWLGGGASSDSGGADLGKIGEGLGNVIKKKMGDDDEKKKQKIAAAKAAFDKQQAAQVTTTIIDAGHNPSEAKIAGLRKTF